MAYATYFLDAGDCVEVCAKAIVQPPVEPPVEEPEEPVRGQKPANCKIVPITWPHGQMIAFSVVMPDRQATVFSGTVNANAPKYMSLSVNPCEFTQALQDAYCGVGAYRQNDVNGGTGICKVTAGKTYYFNVRNSRTFDGADVCPIGTECAYYLAW
jgi:hypothetical protein